MNKLVGLTKTQYTSTVLDLTAHSEEALVNYRHHLLCTINESEPHPLGLLKDRRNTPNGSTAAQKYADDCFVLQEYILGNTPDVKRLLKKQSLNQSVSLPQPTPSRRSQSHTAGSIDVDTNALKETVAIMQAEIAGLKASVNESNEQINVLKTDLSATKHELISCSNIFATHFKLGKESSNDITHLSRGMQALTNIISKLESSRNNHTEAIEALHISTRDNAANISHIKDAETALKNNLKLKVGGLKDYVNEHISLTQNNHVTKKDHDNSLKTIHSKLKTVEQQVLTKPDTGNTDVFCNAFEKLSDSITKQIETLCTNVSNALQPLSTLRAPNHGPMQPTNPLSKQLSNLKEHENQHENHTSAPDVPDAPTVLDVPTARTPTTKNHAPTTNPQKSQTTKSQDEVLTVSIDLTKDVTVDSPTQQRPQQQERGTHINDQFQPQRRRRGRFGTVASRRHRSFVLIGISTDSDQEALEDFLEFDMDIRCKHAKFLTTSRTGCKVAQIVVDSEQADYIENEIEWPPGISCRPWLQRTDYLQRYERHDNEDVD